MPDIMDMGQLHDSRSNPIREGSHASNAFKLRVLVSLVALESSSFFHFLV